jgi:hypothetical protein
MDWPPARQKLDAWRTMIEDVGRRWREGATRMGWPTEVEDWWGVVKSQAHRSVDTISAKKRLWQALAQLSAAADIACAGVGVPDFDHDRDEFSAETTGRLLACLTGSARSTLCKRIHSSKLLVLPKMHTPQKGITLRSLSHHLAACPASDIKPTWCEVISVKKKRAVTRFDHSLTLLLVPMPMEMTASQFVPAGQMIGVEDCFGFFNYVPTPLPPKFIARLKSMCDTTRRCVGGLNGIVFPELAMRTKEYERVRNSLLPAIDFLVAGIHAGPPKGKVGGRNYARICTRFLDGYVEFDQDKHHRWFLDESQIQQYHLGATLNPTKKWWENTELIPRTLNFIALDSYVTFSVLICEDLARAEPVGNLLRAVGPNLLIALLQDGPQLRTRWSARCATVLADDPGTSVLTVTSSGMCDMCRPAGTEASRVIALWKDPETGAREIILPAGYDAVALCLTKKPELEWSADGRNDKTTAGLLKLSGIHPIRVSK